MYYYGSFVLQCYVLLMRVMTSTVGGDLTNRPPALRHIHVTMKGLQRLASQDRVTVCQTTVPLPVSANLRQAGLNTHCWRPRPETQHHETVKCTKET